MPKVFSLYSVHVAFSTQGEIGSRERRTTLRDWPATNTDVIATQSHSLLLVRTKKTLLVCNHMTFRPNDGQLVIAG